VAGHSGATATNTKSKTSTSTSTQAKPTATNSASKADDVNKSRETRGSTPLDSTGNISRTMDIADAAQNKRRMLGGNLAPSFDLFVEREGIDTPVTAGNPLKILSIPEELVRTMLPPRGLLNSKLVDYMDDILRKERVIDIYKSGSDSCDRPLQWCISIEAPELSELPWVISAALSKMINMKLSGDRLLFFAIAASMERVNDGMRMNIVQMLMQTRSSLEDPLEYCPERGNSGWVDKTEKIVKELLHKEWEMSLIIMGHDTEPPSEDCDPEATLGDSFRSLETVTTTDRRASLETAVSGSGEQD